MCSSDLGYLTSCRTKAKLKAGKETKLKSDEEAKLKAEQNKRSSLKQNKRQSKLKSDGSRGKGEGTAG